MKDGLTSNFEKFGWLVLGNVIHDIYAWFNPKYPLILYFIVDFGYGITSCKTSGNFFLLDFILNKVVWFWSATQKKEEKSSDVFLSMVQKFSGHYSIFYRISTTSIYSKNPVAFKIQSYPYFSSKDFGPKHFPIWYTCFSFDFTYPKHSLKYWLSRLNKESLSNFSPILLTSK